jgi:thiamine-monophosphate kinase
MELSFVSWLRKRARQSVDIERGIGDDGAIIASTDVSTVVTCDMLMDGIDFRLDECDAQRVGRKALAVNLSDLAAMAATPIAGFVALALPRDGGRQLAEELYHGLLPLADEFELAIAGGDTNSWDGPLVISITLLGKSHRQGSLRRDGGQVGDDLLVTGSLGGSILGHHFDFQPRVEEARQLHENYELKAGMDISDGLSLDLKRLASECCCGAEIELPAIPVSAAAHEQVSAHRSALEHALHDGEDFELLLAVSPTTTQRLLAAQPLAIPLTRIGRLIEQPGVWQIDSHGERRRLTAEGYEHRLE